ncbi:hypothetical protein FKP32DRAFT_1607466 [Trametes sanguinea]|nr:hypothetical protein FKP32DRAFT_1607466 [Trametes sanguinea]
MSQRVWYYFLFAASDVQSLATQRRRRHEGFLEESEHVRSNHRNRLSIVSLANSVRPGNMRSLTHRLANLLAPSNGGAYFSNSSLRYDVPKALFLWEKRGSVDMHGHLYVVHFKLFASRPFSSHQLALLLLHFALRAKEAHEVHGGDGPSPCLRDLYYALSPNATYGSLVYRNLEAAFNASTRNDDWWTAPTDDGATSFVSTWPEWSQTASSGFAFSFVAITKRYPSEDFPMCLSRLPIDIIREMTAVFDMVPLLNWRQTCRTAYEHGTARLLLDRYAAAKPFASDAVALWELLRSHRALVGGLAALAYVLRDPPPHCHTLEVYVPASACDNFLMDVDLTLGLDWEYVRERQATEAERAHYFFSDVFFYRARGGRSIAVYIATSEAALQPLVTTWSTALVNYGIRRSLCVDVLSRARERNSHLTYAAHSTS